MNITKKVKPILVALSATLATATAQSPVNPALYDDDSSGYLERVNGELKKYFSAINELRTDEVDTDRNGRISAKEGAAVAAKVESRAEEAIWELEELIGKKQAYSIAELQTYQAGNRKWPEIRKDEDDDAGEKWTYYLRNSHEDIGILGKVAKDAAPASIAFSKDFEGGNQESWEIKAAFITRRKLSDGIYFLPSLTLDYAENNSPTGKGEKDSLVGRIGFEFVDSTANGDLTNFYRVNLATATETDFASIQEVLEFQWEPVIGGTAIGVPKEIFGNRVGFLLRPIIHAEFGYVFDAGGNQALQPLEKKFYSRVGPKLKLDVWSNIRGLERFSANLALSHYEAIGGRAESGTHFESTLKYRLDDAGNMFLQLKYEKGEIPLTQDSVDKLTLGAGVKF